MTPARRIARVQRWVDARGLSAVGNAWVRHQQHWAEVSPFAFPEDSYKRFYRRIDRIQNLFSAEIAWLCRYSLGLHALTAGTCIEQMAESAAVEPPETFTCSACRRSVPWSEGAADSHPDLCDRCVPEVQP